METLQRIRPNENILLFPEPISEKSHLADLHAALIKHEKSIIIVNECDNSLVDKFMEEVDAATSGYVFFRFELDIDPVNNSLVPLHRYATKEEIDKLHERKIQDSKIPVLQMKDPIRRWYNFPRDTIVTIERENKSVYYRICK
jgi:DNA-directed RNA polymerase subunit H (RpoH/RPB5)